MFAQNSEHNHLRELIANMEENIDAFEKTNRYYDVLGQMFVAFLRYANTSNDLGVVLTPTHITDLGIEKGDKMYCLAASNMAIHGDGKTNIYPTSGLNPQIISEIRNGIKNPKTGIIYKPNVGFLNPPYKSDKKNDVEELEFVKWNLEALVQGGTCVAIVPMQCAIAGEKKKKIYELKKELLSKHTLEAVFSMPDELFYNSDKSVVTCIMVFTAKKPHPKGYKTFFGYYKDDGLEKRKKLGRIDARGKWKTIKEKWLNLYRNREEIAGESIKHSVTAKDEWCAEAYMETRYDCLQKSMFEISIRDYINYQIAYNRVYSDIIYAPLLKNTLTYNTDNWHWFYLDDKRLFTIKGSKTTSLRDLELSGEGDYPYITTQARNNGVSGFYDLYTENGSCFTIDSAVKGYCSWHEDDFSASDHVEKLIPNFSCNNYIAMFMVTIINMEQYRYNYGLKCSQTRIKNMRIKLPADSNGNPDWKFMEDYIKSLPYSANL